MIIINVIVVVVTINMVLLKWKTNAFTTNPTNCYHTLVIFLQITDLATGQYLTNASATVRLRIYHFLSKLTEL